uniref:Apple domain-containing protein n=1 Tax=Plectus sambesii TaxID=2011161 RepID=A0A914W4J9_9BILA
MTTTSTAGATVTLPANPCTTSSVDPMTHMSLNYMIYPNIANCDAKCANETKFVCQGFTWAGPGTSCVVFGKIDKQAVMLSGSKWFLVDFYCNSGQPCRWPMKASQIDAISLSPTNAKGVQAQSAAHCQTFCLLAVLQPGCKAYAFSADRSLAGGNNCYLFSPLNSTQISSASTGKYDLYQSDCV